MLDAWDRGLGNASGTHASAREAKNLLEEARERAAAVLRVARPLDIVFTSGGTESDNLAVRGVALRRGSGSVVVSAIEHKAVLEAAGSLTAEGFRVMTASPDATATVRPDTVADLVDADTAIVSVMAANNETGTVQPVRDIAAAVRDLHAETPIHTDAVQAFVGGPVDLAALDVDLLTLSAHKFGGPQGVGLLALSSRAELSPITFGGGHEAGRRPGTSNVAGVAGMVAAMEATEADRSRFAAIVGGERDAFEQALAERLPTIRVTGADADRMPHISHVRFPGVRAESLLIRLDRAGIHAAAGSACQSGAIEPSHVLRAIGMTEAEAGECIRFSFGWDTPIGTGKLAAHAVADVVEAMVSP